MLTDLEIKKFFDKIIKDETKGYGLREYLEDTLNYGQSAFTYYRETTEVYDRYRTDCEAWLETLVSERGINPWDLFPDWEIFPESDVNKWIVVVAMFEEYCNYVLEGLE